jgi:predicted nucleic acid-binding protein
MNEIVICDTDALIALFSATDIHKQRAKQTLILLSKQNYLLYFPATVISEAITTSQRRIQDGLLVETIIENTNEGNLPILPVDQDVISIAISLFNPDGSKNNTFFDAIVAATAKKYSAKAIFSFDNWYKKQGFILASDLVSI